MCRWKYIILVFDSILIHKLSLIVKNQLKYCINSSVDPITLLKIKQKVIAYRIMTQIAKHLYSLLLTWYYFKQLC